MTNRRALYIGGAVVLMLVIVVVAAVSFGGDGDSDRTDDDTPDALVDGGTLPPVDDDDAAVPTQTLARQPTLTPRATSTDVAGGPTPTGLPLAITALPSPTPYNVSLRGDVRIDIPSLDFIRPIPIVELPVENNSWDVTNLGYNIGWLDQTTWLEEDWGNTVLVGHVNLSDEEEGPFYYLFQLEAGDEIVIYEDGTPTTFRIYETTTVPATAIRETYPTTNPILTLMTCTNWDQARGAFSERRIVRAYPVDTDELPPEIEENPVTGS